ncbi:MAG: fasciclin domain-containing protein [Chloroflexi bacterium]|nr:fasciclin domain-containing protein [Chloroflexota bacterium]
MDRPVQPVLRHGARASRSSCVLGGIPRRVIRARGSVRLNDDAFVALPEDTVEVLLEDIPALTDILSDHVVSGAIRAADVVTIESAVTVQGESVSITVEGDSVRINDALVVIADIEASNGVIHVIDAVLLPPTE